MSEKLAFGFAATILKEALGDKAPEINLDALAAIPMNPGEEIIIEDLANTSPMAAGIFIAAATLAPPDLDLTLSLKEHQFVSDLVSSLREVSYSILWLNNALNRVPGGAIGVRMKNGKLVLYGVSKEHKKEHQRSQMSSLKDHLAASFPGAKIIFGTPPGFTDDE